MAKNSWQMKVAALLSVTLVALVIGLWMGLVAPARGAALLVPPLTGSSKTVNVNTVPAGGTATYAIVLRNTSAVTTVATATVVDMLDARLSCDQLQAGIQPPGTIGGWNCTSQGITFTVQSMTPSKVVTLTFDVTLSPSVTPGVVITNAATIHDGAAVITTNEVSFTVADAPTVQIRQPISGTLLTAKSGTNVVISGYAWDSSNNPGFPADPVLNPISNPNGESAYFVNWTQDPAALAYHLQESTSLYFDKNLVNYNPTTALSYHYVTGKTPGTYYYRLRAINLAGNSRWSNVRSVVVTSAMLRQVAEVFEPAAAQPAAALPAVQVRINGGTWQAATVTQNATGYWDWTYNWSLPQADDAVYTIQARSQDTGGNYGDIDTVYVTIRNGIKYVYLPLVMRRWPPIAYPPVLTLTKQSNYGDYTLNWTYTSVAGVPDPTSYTIHESFNDPNFTSPTAIEHATGGLSGQRVFTSKLPVGTYYYRVRGNNQYGAGEWSNPQSVVVQERGYYDDFTNANSGWPKQVYYVTGRGVLDTDYDNGTYRMKVLLNPLGLNNRRMGIIPAPYTHTDNTYDIEVQHKFVRAVDEGGFLPTAGKAGIIFYGGRTSSGTGYFETPYIVEWNFEGHCSISRYLNYTYSEGHDPYVPVAWLPRDNLVLNWQPCAGLQAGYDKLNTARVEVRGNQVSVYFNNVHAGTYSITLSGSPHVGLVTGSWDRTPVQSHFNYFRVTDK